MTEGNGVPLLAGLVSGFAVFGIVAMLLRTSAPLPIGKFFAVSSLLVAFLVMVLVGKGVAGLQEAGLLAVQPISVPRIDVLGIYPSIQTLLAQATVLLIAVSGFVVNVRCGTRTDHRQAGNTWWNQRSSSIARRSSPSSSRQQGQALRGRLHCSNVPPYDNQ